VLLKKADGSYRVCVNFKELNEITVIDPAPMMSPDDIFPKLAGSLITARLTSVKDIGLFPWRKSLNITQPLSVHEVR